MMSRGRELGPPSCAKILCSEVAEEDVESNAMRFKHARSLTDMWSKGVNVRRKKEEAAREAKLAANRAERARMREEHKAAVETRVKATRAHIDTEKSQKLSTVTARETSFQATLEPKKKAHLAHLETLRKLKEERLQDASRKVTSFRKDNEAALNKAKKTFVQQHLAEIEVEKQRREVLRKEAEALVEEESQEFSSEVHATKKKLAAEQKRAKEAYMKQLANLSHNVKGNIKEQQDDLNRAMQIAADKRAATQKEHNETLKMVEEKRIRDEAKAAKRAADELARVRELDTLSHTYRLQQQEQAVVDIASVKHEIKAVHKKALAENEAKHRLILPALKKTIAEQKADYEQARRERQEAQKHKQTLEEETYASIVAREFKLSKLKL